MTNLTLASARNRLAKANANLALARSAKEEADRRINVFLDASPRNLEAPEYLAERAKWFVAYNHFMATSKAVYALAEAVEELKWEKANGVK